jgi:predicted MFS family arabinose efflux permease
MKPAGDGEISERKLLFLLGAVLFINVIDFMMVIPLGPDFAAALSIPTARLGLVAGSYTAAAAISGMIGTLFLDRFDRRKALFVSMMGLVIGTAAGGLATNLETMLLARIIAGACGGPASSLTMAIIADVIPIERRGRAIAAVAGASAVASVLGVPAGLQLAHVGGWRLPFFAVAALGAALAMGAIFLMPPMRKHLQDGVRALPTRSLTAFLLDPIVFLALTAMFVLMMGTFSLIANLSAFLQFNLGYPRERLGLLYMVGGLVSFFVMRLAGRHADRRGAVVVVSLGTLVALLAIPALFLWAHPPVLLLFMTMMVSNAVRIVSLNTLTSRIPGPQERARYMSAQSAVQHLATATGAIGSAWVLHERPNHGLDGVPTLVFGTMVLTAAVPLLLAQVAARVRRRDLAAALTP